MGKMKQNIFKIYSQRLKFSNKRQALYIQNLMVAFFTIATSFLLLNFKGDFKISVMICFIVMGLLWISLRNFFLALFWIFLITSQFIEPGKYYSFVLIEIGKIQQEPFFSQGLIDGFGLVNSDIFAFLLTLYLFRLFLFELKGRFKKNFLNLLSTKQILFISVCWTSFFLWALSSSLNYSFYPIFSVVNLFQYMKMIVFFISTSYLILSPNLLFKPFLISILSGLIVFQSLLGGLQILAGLASIGENHRNESFSIVTEEKFLFPRSSGAFLHSNQFGLFMFLFLLILMISKSFLNFQKEFPPGWLVAMSGLCIGSIIFSQSRTIWFCSLLTLIWYLFYYGWKELKFYSLKVLKDISFKQSVLIATLTVVILSVVIPRFFLSMYTLEGGGGSIRLRMLDEGSQALQESLIFGFGVNTNVNVLYERFPNGYLQDFPYAIHIGYLQLALESGIIGVVFFFTPFIVLLRKRLVLLINSKLGNMQIFFSACGILSLLIYYCLQPHGGRLELPLLGLVLAFFFNVDQGKKRKTATLV